jgi:Asp-tRNA(Asn)/Glu-tRNA(Gln) amidotransferase A subunit family amidase
MNFSGNPTLSLPFGEGALPDSLQLVGRHREEALLSRVGHAFERVAGRARRPPLG